MCACSLASGVRADTVLYLKSAIEVSSKDVLLGDLAMDAAQLPASWASRRVLAAPAAGETSYHALTAVAHGLARYEDMNRVTLSGEPVISVTRRDRRVEKDEFYQPLCDYLEKTAPWNNNKLEVSIMSIPRNIRVPAGKATYRIIQLDQKTSKGYSLAHVALLVDGEQVAEVPVGLEIQFLSEVWVAAHNLERGCILTEEDLRSEMHVVDSSSNYVSSREMVAGHEVTRAISLGDILPRNAISKPLCAKRGDWVAVNAKGANLHITLRGKAMANGRLGDRIMCVNERSHRQVLVQLTGIGNGVLVRL
jgi:flagella basal body P-ring formation protein FlgA